MPGSVTNIFISYGRSDSRELAMRLRDDLEAVGFSVWLDLTEIPGGASWSENIEDAIEHCHVALALMSPASYSSQWCRAEILRAIRKGKRVVPLLAVAGTEPPLHLEHMNYLDFTGLDRYDEIFRDLLSDLTASGAFQPAADTDDTNTPFKPPRQRTRTGYKDEKRDAPSFRRFLKNLRQEEWLGARFWWPYFLFHYTDIHSLVEILRADALQSPFQRGGDLNTRWDKHVRLHFRPRTPDLYREEGFVPMPHPTPYCPLPVYLLFDMEAVICHPSARFCEGDPTNVGKTYQTASFFRELPFEQIYHDSWFMPDERDEILRYRDAQVLVPDELGLESLQLIWVRSDAEYETLHHLLPPELWHQWHNKITARSDYHLFNNKRPYVQSVILQDDHARIRFNQCQSARDCGPFHLRLILQTASGDFIDYEDPAYTPDDDLIIQPPAACATYTLQMLLDGDVAYAGEYMPAARLL